MPGEVYSVADRGTFDRTADDGASDDEDDVVRRCECRCALCRAGGCGAAVGTAGAQERRHSERRNRAITASLSQPLVRRGVPALVKRLAQAPGVKDLALTTNGMLLGEQAAALRAAGLHLLNISLDALSEPVF